jgi:hypothetical protein
MTVEQEMRRIEPIAGTAARERAMDGWVDQQASAARTRADRLVREAAEERLARAASTARPGRTTLRLRLAGAVAGWREPGKALAS